MISWFSAVNETSGEIISVFNSDVDSAGKNIPKDCFLVEGKFDRNLGYFLDNDYILYTESEIVRKSNKPNYISNWSNDLMMWVDARSSSQVEEDFRLNRNNKLNSSDWTQVADAPVDHAAWAVYRQELRDLPENTEDPRNPVWPTRPN